MPPLLLSGMFDFSFLPKYSVYFVRGVEYTLILSACAVFLAILPALLLALKIGRASCRERVWQLV